MIVSTINLKNFFFGDIPEEIKNFIDQIHFSKKGSQIFSKGIDLGRTLWDQDLIRFKPQGLNILAKALMQRYS